MIRKGNKEKFEFSWTKKDKELNDIGGWLALLIFTLVIFSPIYNIFLLSEWYPTITIFEIVNILSMISLLILAGIFLWNKKPYAVKFTKIFLITTFFENLFFYSISKIASNESQILDYNLNINLSSLFGFFIVWTLYIYNSKRVERIYGHLKEKNEGYQVWSILSIIYAFLEPIFAIVISIVSLINISRNRKLKGMGLSIIALVISVVMIFSFLLVGAFLELEQQSQSILEGNYAHYYEISPYEKTDFNISLKSDIPMDVFVVASEEDFNRFILRDTYNKNKECSYRSKKEISFNCNISKGGIVVYNPNIEKATYIIELK